MNKFNNDQGFTLVELLVVISILGILATISLGSFRSSQIKSRDAKRKFDLEQVQRALETYYNDFGKYPLSSGGGLIINYSWGSAFVDPAQSDTLYMKELPKDPLWAQSYSYCYQSTNGLDYQIYARLENTNDPQKFVNFKTCNGEAIYNYGVASSNTVP